MTKKEAPERCAELSKEQQRRLDKLAEEWDKSSYFLGKLTLADLRLLLEHFPPLRALIHAIAASSTEEAARETTESALRQAEAAQSAECAKELRTCQQELAAAKARNTEIEAALAALRTDRDALARQIAQREQALAAARTRIAELEAQRDDLQKQLAAASAERDRLRHAARRHPVLDALRADPELASYLRLDRLPDDPAEALACAAAVFARWDQIERLWERLKERCNRAQRPASKAEIMLLETALAWHNLGYASPLYALDHPAPGTPFDFQRHQRANATPGGERIQALWLPGLCDCDRNALIKKPLVATA